MKLQHLVEDANLKAHPYGEERCKNCLYYLDTDADLSYCWHPKVRILVDEDWWCQWWEEPRQLAPAPAVSRLLVTHQPVRDGVLERLPRRSDDVLVHTHG